MSERIKQERKRFEAWAESMPHEYPKKVSPKRSARLIDILDGRDVDMTRLEQTLADGNPNLPIVFLSFGAGVQSTVMLMLAIHDEIERPDHVLFSDTGWESEQTMRTVYWAQRQCEKAGIPFHIVGDRNIRDDNILAKSSGEGGYEGKGSGHWLSVPLFVDTEKGKGAQLRRQCTAEYKITPLRKKQRELLGYKPRQRIKKGSSIVMIGISTDEARRASQPRNAWQENIFPLIDPLKMSRSDCQAWWEKHYPSITIAKSGCVGCPYNSNKAWIDMKRNRPEEFKSAVEFDNSIRGATGSFGKGYIHRSMQPLGEIDFNDDQGELSLDDAVYCAGGCGL